MIYKIFFDFSKKFGNFLQFIFINMKQSIYKIRKIRYLRVCEEQYFYWFKKHLHSSKIFKKKKCVHCIKTTFNRLQIKVNLSHSVMSVVTKVFNLPDKILLVQQLDEIHKKIYILWVLLLNHIRRNILHYLNPFCLSFKDFKSRTICTCYASNCTTNHILSLAL